MDKENESYRNRLHELRVTLGTLQETLARIPKEDTSSSATNARAATYAAIEEVMKVIKRTTETMQ